MSWISDMSLFLISDSLRTILGVAVLTVEVSETHLIFQLTLALHQVAIDWPTRTDLVEILVASCRLQN